MPKISIEAGNYGWDYYIASCERGSNKDYLIESDWDYAPTARLIGWSPACYYNEEGDLDGGGCGTDGTVDCHKGCRRPQTVSGHLTDAADYLDAHLGDVFEIGEEEYDAYFPRVE